MYRKSLLLLFVLASVVLAGCAEEQPEADRAGDEAPQGGAQATSEEITPGTTAGTTMAGGTTAMVGTTFGATMEGITGGGTTVIAGGEATIGGFVVESPNAPDTTIPQVSVSQAAAREYLDQVQPIIDASVRDVSGLVQPEVRVENGNLSLDLPVSALEEARGNIQEGVNDLRQLDPPQGLEPINQQLIEAFERAQPAYTNIIEAANSGDAGRVNSAVQENLPRIERFNAETRAILQDLEQAAGTGQ